MQIKVPDSVAKRFSHSMSTYYKSKDCVWILIKGGNYEVDPTTILAKPITGSNINVIMELGNNK